jgi:hypothetical protein
MEQLPVLNERAFRFDEVILEAHALRSQAQEIEVTGPPSSDANAHQILEIRSNRPEVFECSQV